MKHLYLKFLIVLSFLSFNVLYARNVDINSSTQKDGKWKYIEGEGTPTILAELDPDYPGLEVIQAVGATNNGEWFTKIFIFFADGELMRPWDPMVIQAPARISAPPAVNDINRDGKPEIIYACHSHTFVFNIEGDTLPGWPHVFPGVVCDPPVVADLDRDSFPEIIVCEGNNVTDTGCVHIWNHDGTYFNSAWPKYVDKAIHSQVAVGNLDRDPELEIVVGTSSGNTNQSNNMVYAWNPDGSSLNSNWPRELSKYYGAFTPSIADIDEDSEMEIVIGTGHHVDAGSVNVWETDGSSMSPEWPKFVSGYAFYCAICDLHPDYPGLDIVTSISQSEYLHAWHGDGTPVAGWPYKLKGEGRPPMIGDVDCDGQMEVVVNAWYRVYVINHDGTDLEGWPKYTYAMQVPSTMEDVDFDGNIEIFQPISDYWLYRWEIESGPAIGELPWPVVQKNNQHTGYVPLSNQGVNNEKQKEDIKLVIPPVIMNGREKIRLNLPGRSKVKIEIYDITGAKVKTVLNSYLTEGEHNITFNFEKKKQTSGVYFLHCVVDNSKLTRKFILFK